MRDLIEKGADEFLLGGYGAFDMLAARTLRKLKKEYPNIRTTLVLAFLDQGFNNELYDDTVYPPLE